MTGSDTEIILGHRVYRRGIAQCIDEIEAAILRSRKPRWLACINPHSYVMALKDEGFGAALRRADWLVPDGVGIVQASFLLGGQIRRRITGSDVFRHVHERIATRAGARVFLLGATPVVLEAMRRRMAFDWPSVEVVGIYSPPFADRFTSGETEKIIDLVNSAAPDVLWVGLSAPKQELLIGCIVDRLNVRFIGAVGAVFDFYAGRVKRSPKLFQRIGLEWLPRLLQEPRRLWRRTFISGPLFLWHVLRERAMRLDLWR